MKTVKLSYTHLMTKSAKTTSMDLISHEKEDGLQKWEFKGLQFESYFKDYRK